MPKVRWVMSYGFCSKFLYAFQPYKNFENGLTFDKVREFKGGNVFETQCSCSVWGWKIFCTKDVTVIMDFLYCTLFCKLLFRKNMTSFTKSKNSLMFFSCNEHLVPVNMQQQQPCLTFHLTHNESPGDDLHSVSLEKNHKLLCWYFKPTTNSQHKS